MELSGRSSSRRIGAVVADVRGQGDLVVLVPSLGRGGVDFDDLATRLVEAGFRTAAIDPRGVGASDAVPPEATLNDLAADVAVVIEQLAPDGAHVVGHAFGNRLARCLATNRPQLVRSVILLGAGGLIPMDAAIEEALVACFDSSLPEAEHIACIRKVFFADGNDPTPWRDGWWRAAAEGQIRALRRVQIEDWWTAGRASALVIQGLSDAAAVPENGRRLAERLGERCRLVEIEHAGHALLPEQPDLVAGALLDFLHSVRT